MKEQANLSAVAGGLLAAINYIGYFTGAIIAIKLKSHLHKFYFYRISLVAAIVTTVAMGFTTNYFAWGMLRFLSGISSIAGFTLASGLVLEWLTTHHFKKELGLHFSGIGLGIFFSGVVFLLFEKSFSWDKLWFIYGVLGILFFLPAWFWLPKPTIEAANKTSVSSAENVSRKWFWLMLSAYFCAGFGYVISATFIVDMLKQLSTFQGKSAFIWLIVGLSGMPATYLWDFISRKTGAINSLIIAYLLQVVSVLIPAFSAAQIPNLIGAILFGSTFVGIVSLTLTLIGNNYPQNPVKAMSKLTLTYGLAQIIAPIISGYSVKTTGNYVTILCITALLIVVGTFLLVLLQWVEKD
ncbi:MFS transporter [Olivibacter ginsenosidimutans]|uniref:MFS transporter n=2 Tax=Olivibacter ginsenosidimutans TaxID=1176537 RepID=A0ABP9AUC7_9SPHI